jgi:hypothetical protein
MTAETWSEQQEPTGKYSPELLAAIPNGTIFAYNLEEKNTAGGMKVRWKIRVANGPEAARAEARQAEAIKEALVWLRKHPQTRPAR